MNNICVINSTNSAWQLAERKKKHQSYAENSKNVHTVSYTLYVDTFYVLYTLYVHAHLYIQFFLFYSACVSPGTNLLTMHAPNNTNAENVIFSVKFPRHYNAMFFINEKREISFRGCLDYEV